MLLNINSMASQHKYKQSFGSFPAPKNVAESFKLRDKATIGELLPTTDNIESLKVALKKGTVGTMGHLKDIAEHWSLKLEELLK